ncbi:MAG: hypothetical protein GQ565_10440 [Candidatus Aegiribacteria sp.]|nr:hypothetical protein [Candidatus Aegiribacteria sp.]
MTTNNKREQIVSWFLVPKPELPWKSLVIGFLLLVCGVVIAVKLNGGVGAVIAIVGVIYGSTWPFKSQAGKFIHSKVFNMLSYSKAKAKYTSRPSSNQMNQWLTDDLDALKMSSVVKCGLDESEIISESIALSGPVFWSINGLNNTETRMRRWAGNGYLYAVWDVVVIHFTEKCISVYRCPYNWVRNVSVNEKTEEYYYQDINTVTTDSESSAYTLFEGKLESSRTFKVTVSSGDSLKVLIDDPQLKTMNSEELTSRGDKAVQTIRRMLRDKK